MAESDRYIFIVEWYDTRSTLFKDFQLVYFPSNNELLIYDQKKKRPFLKRQQVKGITIKDLYIGGVLNIYSRNFKIKTYGDKYTENNIGVKRGKTFALIKPEVYTSLGKIISMIEQSGFLISKMKLVKLQAQQAEWLFGYKSGTPFFKEEISFLCSDFVCGLEIVGDNCVNKFLQFAGDENCQIARVENPGSIRAKFGTEGVRNALHCSISDKHAQKELDFFFSNQSKIETAAYFKNCTCCIIKPHILDQRMSGQIIDRILNEGFEISALEIFHMDRQSAEEFLELYKGVLPEFKQMAEHLTTGPCLAMEIRQEKAVESFRSICGPHDPAVAKQQNKNSLRAQYGLSRVKNAVHCTDLPEDGVMEVEYFFSIMQQK